MHMCATMSACVQKLNWPLICNYKYIQNETEEISLQDLLIPVNFFFSFYFECLSQCFRTSSHHTYSTAVLKICIMNS